MLKEKYNVSLLVTEGITEADIENIRMELLAANTEEIMMTNAEILEHQRELRGFKIKYVSYDEFCQNGKSLTKREIFYQEDLVREYDSFIKKVEARRLNIKPNPWEKRALNQIIPFFVRNITILENILERGQAQNLINKKAYLAYLESL